jgi:hypothetical protein
MSEILKFSLSYSSDEDRLAWDLEADDGEVTRLWLTQRLARNFVEAIVPVLAKAAPPNLAPEHAATVQSFEQAAALSTFGKVSGVKPTPQSTTGLIHQIQITPKDGRLLLNLQFGDQARLVGVGGAEIRQTLSVIYRLQQAAGWPLDHWPAWIADPGAAAALADTLN